MDEKEIVARAGYADIRFAFYLPQTPCSGQSG